MTFLSPSVLFALAAVSIPIIIHLFSKFKTHNVEFSTIRFIKALEHETIRNIKIKQWLILLLRMLMIFALVLLFARPVLEGFIPGWMGAELESRVVIVMDNSASMSTIIEGESRLSRSKKSLINMLELFGENTSFDLYQTNPPKKLFTGEIDFRAIKSITNAIPPTASNDNIWTFVDSSLSQVKTSEPNKECIIFSDFQTWPEPIQNKKRLKNDWRYYLVSQGEIQDNLSILNVKSMSRVKTKDQLIKLNTRIVNNGKLPKKNIPIELFFDQQRVGQVVTEFSPETSKDFLFQAFPTGNRMIHSVIQLPPDDFALDNQQIMNLPIIHEINCVLFSSSIDDIFMLKTALNAIDEKEAFLSIDTRIQPELKRLFLGDADVAIFHNPGVLSEKSIKELQTFLEKGGGVIWFAGGQKNQDEALAELGIPASKSVVELNSGYFQTQPSSEFFNLFQDLNVRRLDREMPEVFKYDKISTQSNDQILITLNHDEPFLLERSLESGQLFYFSSLIDLRWNDFAMRGSFIPILHKLLLLSGTDEMNSNSVWVNEPKWIALNHKLLRNTWELFTPNGSKEKLIPDYQKKGLRIQNTSELGSYTVYSDGQLFTSFATLLHPDEIPSNPPKQAQLLSFFPDDNAKWLENSHAFKQVFNEARHGKSLWKTFLLIVMIAFLGETLLSRGSGEVLKKIKVGGPKGTKK
ncbi:MAG: hypothetical protein HOG20_03575 [Candidatus Marinimicrobia bacterium]|jgi:hypothetical protein|nr:hypothetical protein [Candidatus Neomarinimicrobiota bacterium]MBT3495927.1 hypothetical protein [Candidatus Neomarinimicrobiota bacterium]MBT3692284.1 hypothetical protein [Candidatus Neomarinimicrobiota bacterium]MBT6158896.1 hypothetical protein [Candidatus Neomarinimicrobiota bacterium]